MTDEATDELVDDEVNDELVDDEVNVLGDQDALNTSGYQYPADAHIPTAQNVRRYPELFNEDVIESFNVPNPDHEKATDADADSDADVDIDAEAEEPSGEPLDATTITDHGDDSGDFGSSTRVTY